MPSMDNYFCEAESENLNLIHLMIKMQTKYKMTTVVLKGADLRLRSKLKQSSGGIASEVLEGC